MRGTLDPRSSSGCYLGYLPSPPWVLIMSRTKPQSVWVLKHTFCDGTDAITTYVSYKALLLRLARILDHACEDNKYEIELCIPYTEEQEQSMLDNHIEWQAKRKAEGKN